MCMVWICMHMQREAHKWRSEVNSVGGQFFSSTLMKVPAIVGHEPLPTEPSDQPTPAFIKMFLSMGCYAKVAPHSHLTWTLVSCAMRKHTSQRIKALGHGLTAGRCLAHCTRRPHSYSDGQFQLSTWQDLESPRKRTSASNWLRSGWPMAMPTRDLPLSTSVLCAHPWDVRRGGQMPWD